MTLKELVELVLEAKGNINFVEVMVSPGQGICVPLLGADIVDGKLVLTTEGAEGSYDVVI